MADKIIKYDVEGYEVISNAIMELINQYPGLSDGDKFTFDSLSADGGKTMQPVGSAIVETERISVTGHVRQVCLYPFFVYNRVPAGLSGEAKISTKEWLDNLGRWLEGRTVLIDGTEYNIDKYPPLRGNRKFLSIERQTQAAASDPTENNMQDWSIYISARYQNEFERKYL